MWYEALASFEVTLERNGKIVERGDSANVLGGPPSALKHVAEQPSRFLREMGWLRSSDLHGARPTVPDRAPVVKPCGVVPHERAAVTA